MKENNYNKHNQANDTDSEDDIDCDVISDDMHLTESIRQKAW